MNVDETTQMVLSTENLMGFSILVLLVMSLIIWLKLKAASTYDNVISVACPNCEKSMDIAYNSIGHDIECPDCSEKFKSQPNS